MMWGWVLLFWASSLPCDQACHARMAAPMPWWAIVAGIVAALLVSSPALTLTAYLAIKRRLARHEGVIK